MSVKELREGIEAENVLFGIKQALKLGKKAKNVFIAKDARDDTVEKLESVGVEFDVLKSKEDLTKELNLDFECEVFSLK
jgi:ribosomal protein L7Ae-like RNA K-turn-binding protein|tara:strand:- start:676 stop:912 length:237 start_codon:yes stop_codon:yes gene_type:complete